MQAIKSGANMGKDIIICCDGTANSAEAKNPTNIVKIYNLAKDVNSVVYYDPGVSTIKIKGPFSWLKDKLQYAFGYGLTENIKEAYSYIQKNYEEGDRIFLFGFSRGAYTVRSLANLVYNCGLCHESKDIDEAIRIYKHIKNFQEEAEFKKTHSRHVNIEFIGVFDTVASLGYLYGKKYFDANLNPGIKNACHALAIDEKRKRSFKPELWDNSFLPEQSVQQVWFVGAHSDVGGGYDDSGLSDITLKWIIDKAEAVNMKFDKSKLTNIKPDYMAVPHVETLLINGPRIILKKALIHESVFKKISEDSTYSPKNLPKEYSVIS